MPKVSKSKDHKIRLQKFKTNQKRSMTENKTQAPQLPPYRHVPVWDKDSKVGILGYEWEVIYNTVAQMQLLAQATNAVMSRNIVNGVIGMDFQKLDPATLDYVEMTPEEKAPLIEDFKNTLDKLKESEKAAKQGNSIPIATDSEVEVKSKPAKVVKMKAKEQAEV